MEFSRQEYWSGLPFPTPVDLPNPGIKPVSFASTALEAVSLPLCHLGSPRVRERYRSTNKSMRKSADEKVEDSVSNW